MNASTSSSPSTSGTILCAQWNAKLRAFMNSSSLQPKRHALGYGPALLIAHVASTARGAGTARCLLNIKISSLQSVWCASIQGWLMQVGQPATSAIPLHAVATKHLISTGLCELSCHQTFAFPNQAFYPSARIQNIFAYSSGHIAA